LPLAAGVRNAGSTPDALARSANPQPVFPIYPDQLTAARTTAIIKADGSVV